MGEKTISQTKKDWSISAIRFLAMAFIVTCHFMQYLECEMAWWFNVGVQIFLCISGYLYGNKHVEPIGFLKKSFKKILVGYYLVFVPAAVVLMVLGVLNYYEAFLGLLMGSVIPGGEHLWFVPTILCCYLITPFLQLYFKDTKNPAIKYGKILLIVFWLFSVFIPFFNAAWISCYITGYFIARLENTKWYRIFAWIIVISAFMSNAVQISAEYIFDLSVPFEDIVYDYAHLLLGVSIFLILKFILRNMKENVVLRFSDAYSYEIYLVHQFFILGPLTMMTITPFVWLNIVLAVIAILIVGIICKLISNQLHRGLIFIENRIK